MTKVLLKTVAAEVGLEEKRLRKLLRDKAFVKTERQWSWDEGSADLAKIRAEAKAWDKEEKAETPVPTDNVVQFPEPAPDSSEPMPEAAEEPIEPADPAADEVTPEPETEPETEAQ